MHAARTHHSAPRAPQFLRRASVWTLVLAAVLLPSRAFAFGPRVGSSERVNPAPTSYMSKSEAKTIAKLWSMGAPGRAYCEVEPTSSMVPVFDSKSVLLLEQVKTSDLHKNDIARYDSDTYGNVTHRIIEIDPKGAVFEGDNCPRSDGRVLAKSIRYRVAGILYTSGL